MLKSKNPTALQFQKWVADALLELMDHNAYSNISVTQLCRLAKLDRRTFYRNFDSKDDLLQYCISVLGDEYLASRNTLGSKDFYTIAQASLIFWGEHSEFIVLLNRHGLAGVMFVYWKDSSRIIRLCLAKTLLPALYIRWRIWLGGIGM